MKKKEMGELEVGEIYRTYDLIQALGYSTSTFYRHKEEILNELNDIYDLEVVFKPSGKVKFYIVKEKNYR